MTKCLILFLFILSLSGCALTQKYEEPKAPCNGFKKTSTEQKDCTEKPLPGVPVWA